MFFAHSSLFRNHPILSLRILVVTQVLTADAGLVIDENGKAQFTKGDEIELAKSSYQQRPLKVSIASKTLKSGTVIGDNSQFDKNDALRLSHSMSDGYQQQNGEFPDSGLPDLPSLDEFNDEISPESNYQLTTPEQGGETA